MGAGRVLCDDVLRRRMRTCVLSVSSTVGRSVDPGTTSRHFGAELDKKYRLHQIYCMEPTAEPKCVKIPRKFSFVFSVKASESRCLQSNSDARAYYMSAHARPLL